MVGDSVKADIEGARRIGMRAVLVRRAGDGLSSPLQHILGPGYEDVPVDRVARRAARAAACSESRRPSGPAWRRPRSRIRIPIVTTIRPLHTIPEFREVIALEQEIWGASVPDDAVGIPLFVATLKRGAILLGACDGGRLVGFVYSFPGLKNGRPMQWSHMLGVRPEYRASGIGRELKLEQRRVSLAMGIDLMEWTFDPLVAVNARLNFRRLGVVVEEYVVNVYGDSSEPAAQGRADGPVHRAVVDALAPRGGRARADAAAPGRRGFLGRRAALSTPSVARARWLACAAHRPRTERAEAGRGDPGRASPTCSSGSPTLAHAWRMATARDLLDLSLERLPGGRLRVRARMPTGGTYLLGARAPRRRPGATVQGDLAANRARRDCRVPRRRTSAAQARRAPSTATASAS
ncbi:MAG: HAD hydrolase-like protein [Candidatus Moduliflexus flocculans]|nr:HAD hydrolase-like protein [Candidatus Moduliflexus flocculans]